MNEKITIFNRNEIELIGANKVTASTQKEAVVELENGVAVISGENLEVVNLNLESKEVKFTGIITGVKFEHKKEKIGLLKRIFK